jgi:hypothetical protein
VLDALAHARAQVRAQSIQALKRNQRTLVGSVIKKRRKRMSKKKHRKLLRKTRVQRRKLKK